MSEMKHCLECNRAFHGRRKSPYCSYDCKFWSMFDKSGGPDACWPWKSNRAPNGYGNVSARVAGKRMNTHRYAYILAHGSDPGPLSVCHDCDFRACGNPTHLWAGTQRENMMDAIAKGRYVAVAPGELHPMAKLSDEKVRAILTSHLPPGVLAARYGVARETIRAVQARKTWRHVAVDELEEMAMAI